MDPADAQNGARGLFAYAGRNPLAEGNLPRPANGVGCGGEKYRSEGSGWSSAVPPVENVGDRLSSRVCSVDSSSPRFDIERNSFFEK